MSARPISLSLGSPEETCAFAARVGALLRPGDVLLLSGGIGAGKTHFARCLIQSLLIEPEDVPSPTFTLVQVYDTRAGALWHSDLYRLSNPDEVLELGLDEAFDDAICLVEWPDRLGDLTPGNSLQIGFSSGPSDDARVVSLSWSDPRWDVLAEEVSA